MASNYEDEENNYRRDLYRRSNSLNYSSDEENTSYSRYKNYSDESTLDFSYLSLDCATLVGNLEASASEENSTKDEIVRYVNLQHNRLEFFPGNICKFQNVRKLDLGNNQLAEISESILCLKQLTVLNIRNNFLGDYSFPKKFGHLQSLQELNISGNILKTFPPEIIDLKNLRSLYLGGNAIEEVPREICQLEKLEILYLGGNNLKDIPAEMGRLHCLKSLVLCENQLQSLPSTISCLRGLCSLLLHKNQLTTLPPEIVTLRGLVELSLRDNPLVVRFVQELTYDPPSLLELASRCIKIHRVPFKEQDIPYTLAHYLRSAQQCVNPKCRGVYFDVRVEHIKFVDFCGKYRIPLLQYLCSPLCSVQPAFNNPDNNSSDEECEVPKSRIDRVLLG